jgi:hypothetical protein
MMEKKRKIVMKFCNFTSIFNFSQKVLLNLSKLYNLLL